MTPIKPKISAKRQATPELVLDAMTHQIFVSRNRERFPQDFIFELTQDDYANLKSQFATSNLIAGNTNSASHGGRRKLPMAFTEHGAIIAASMLSSLLEVPA